MHLRVDARRVWMLVTQKAANLRERGTLLEHLGCQRVAKYMCSGARGLDLRPRQSTGSDYRNRGSAAQAAPRRVHTDKDMGECLIFCV